MGIVSKKIAFKSEGQTVRGSLFLPDAKENVPIVIFFHGMTSSEKRYLPIAEHFAQLGIAAMTVNLRGHGKSDGDFNKLKVANIINDGVVAYDFVQTIPEIDKSRIGLFGSSVGTTVVSFTATKRAVKSLVFRAPAAYTNKMLQMTLQETMNAESSLFKGNNIEETLPFQALEAFKGSLLIVSSENDELIPADTPRALLSEAKIAQEKKLVIIPQATHQLTDPEWKNQLLEIITNWFAKTL